MHSNAATTLPSELARWIDDAMKRTPYGEISVTVRLHEGRAPIVERSVTERVKVDSDNRNQS